MKSLNLRDKTGLFFLILVLAFIAWVIGQTAGAYLIPTTARAQDAFQFSQETLQAQKVYDSNFTAKQSVEKAYCDSWINLALMKALDYNNAGDTINSRAMSEKAADLAYGNCGFINPR